jgi:hypothetical protein
VDRGPRWALGCTGIVASSVTSGHLGVAARWSRWSGVALPCVLWALAYEEVATEDEASAIPTTSNRCRHDPSHRVAHRPCPDAAVHGSRPRSIAATDRSAELRRHPMRWPDRVVRHFSLGPLPCQLSRPHRHADLRFPCSADSRGGEGMRCRPPGSRAGCQGRSSSLRCGRSTLTAEHGTDRHNPACVSTRNQRARREVDWAPARDSTTTPIVGVAPAAPTPRPASLPAPTQPSR